jgi:hypothetical protein
VSSLKRGSRWECIRLAKLERELPFAQRLLGDVGAADCAGWRDTALRTLAPASVRREMGLLASVWERALDDDNLAAGFKSVRDGIADALGIDDRDPRVTWAYAQQRGEPKTYSALARFDPIGSAAP